MYQKRLSLIHISNIAARDDATIIQQMNFGYARENTGESWIDNVKVYFDPMAALQLSVDQLAVGDPTSASGNILLSTGALDGATVDWISSRPDVVTNSGRVTRQETATEVTMTAIVQNYGCLLYTSQLCTVYRLYRMRSARRGGSGISKELYS